MFLDEVHSPIGLLGLVWRDDALWGVHRAGSDRWRALREGHSVSPTPAGPAFERYARGELGALARLPIGLAGTDFQVQVWRALHAVPVGQTTTYGALASTIGRPGATRAVGTAVGRNPLALVIPCHRVLAAGGRLGGFAWGLDAKRVLLAHEGLRDGAATR